MTTKPKARKFRIKRNAPAADTAQPDAALQPTDAPQSPATAEAPAAAHAAPKQQAQPTSPAKTPPQPAARAGEVASQKQVSGELDINAIRREGLTGRQLRMARRVAEKHNLAPTSDFDAVRLLRAKGIDPFQRSNMLELVVPQNENDPLGAAPTQKPQKIGSIQLPQTVPGGNANLPSTEVSNAETREKAISQMQRDISRRRRRRLGLLLVRLCFFVLIPTFAAGYYFNKIATPMYATDSQFLIIQNEGGGGASPFGGLLPTQFANSADSIATQAYLQSKDAMLRLDEDAGFKEHFADENIDPIQRLDANATTEEAYKTYKKRVKIGYDPTEGVIRMEVIASDPAVSAAFSQKLLKYAEERVNDLSSQKRQDGMRDALEGFEKAQQNRRNAQEALIRMQVENGVDPEAVIGSIRAQIGNYETLLIEKELELAALLDNARPNRAKVDGAQGDVRRLTALIERLETKMSSATDGENSLAEKAVTMQLAMADLAAADVVLQASQTAMEQARTEANRQVRYLTIAVEPVAPEEAAYPRKFENTLLTFLIFAGVYLMLSLTASILREQITS
jgi:capsular polysaccharide transport system permease protein